ncbi:unnamed protein product [Trichobilharzia szidati]|nr:unnamed protein product [Trichobilharzia szidati]
MCFPLILCRSSLLDEATHKAAVALSRSKTLIVLGDEECGKSTLIARLQGTHDQKKGYGLYFTVLDIKDEERDDQTELKVWLLDSHAVHNQLFKFAVDAESFGDCFAMICVSMAEPWKIMNSLEEWVTVLRKLIDQLKIPEQKLQKCKDNVLRHFRGYLEPDVLAKKSHVSSISMSKIEHSDTKPADTARKLTRVHPATVALISNTLREVPDKNSESAVECVETSSESNSNENTLCNNLGIPIVVVITKADTMNNLEKQHKFTEEYFDFIQMHVRRFCLSYGAALFYVSVKDDKNCDLLNRYLQSRIYGFPFTQTAYVVERDCIFVPAGWDNGKKIGILQENLTEIKPLSLYSDVIPQPQKDTAVRELEVAIQDDQTFLTRLMVNLQRDGAQPNSPVPGSPDSVTDQISTPTALLNSPAVVGNRSVSGSPRTSASRTKPVTTGGGPTPTAGTGTGASEGVLANFFNSLLSKRGTGVSSNISLNSSGSLDRSSMSQKDIQSELERLARGSREVSNTTDCAIEQLVNESQQKLQVSKSSESPKFSSRNNASENANEA